MIAASANNVNAARTATARINALPLSGGARLLALGTAPAYAGRVITRLNSAGELHPF